MTAAITVAMAAPEERQGHWARGEFDLESARVERQQLHDRLVQEMPAGAREDRIVVAVSEQELAAISVAETRLRIGIVKNIGSPIRFAGDVANARGSQGARVVGRTGRTGGDEVWATTIEAPGATALRLHFEDFALAPSSEVYLHTGRGEAFGPYTGRGLLGTGEFWSHTIAGDSVTVQIRMPDGGRSSFRIAEIGYVDLTKAVGYPEPDPQSGEQLCSGNAACVENANCNNIPAAIQNVRDAYAHMEFVSGAFLYYCSGGLIADAAGSQTPYFLTANHCLSTSSIASSLQAFFQYETGCNGTCPALYFYNQTPPPFPRTVGATVKATGATSDYTLLQLSQPAPAGSFFLGWNRTAVANSNGTALYRISHPGGAPQAYSTHVVDTSKATCGSWPRGAWIYSRDTLGATEGGSSGSPVLNSSGQVVGQLTGACGFNVNNVCDSASNATVDGAFANYYCSVRSIINPNDTSCGASCAPVGQSCTANSECCSGSCKGRPGRKTCK